MKRAFGITAALLLGACLHGNNAPSQAIDVRVSVEGGQYVVSWPGNGLTELIVGRCASDCAEVTPAEPSSEFSELVPDPDFSETSWRITSTTGLSSPITLGVLPAGATEETAYTEPTTGLHGVAITTEVPRGSGTLVRWGAATLP